MTTLANARYAVYWAPAQDDPLWLAGSRWLGRDAAAAGIVHTREEQPTSPAAGLTASPALYGFHATLKPPMRLRPGCTEAALLDSVAALAAGIPAFTLPPLVVAWLGACLTIRPELPIRHAHPLWRLADACVADLDDWRLPPSDDEIARRLQAGLTAEQTDLLRRWGYPHVMSHWRFHMTLSDPMPARDSAPAQALMASARTAFDALLATPQRARDICVFRQDDTGAPFWLLQRCPLLGTEVPA